MSNEKNDFGRDFGRAPQPFASGAAPTAFTGSEGNNERSQSITPPGTHKAAGFRRATKRGAKARVAIVGVSGSGKSYTSLLLARALAGPTGKIAAVDTEHGSLSKYADLFEFDGDEPSSYTTEYLTEQLTFAEQNGYAVFLVDSLSHFWMGKDGALEFVDAVRKRDRNGDSWSGWKKFAPHERGLVDRFLASPCHVIVTMRVKTDYEEQVIDGKKKRVKVGLAPVQREGLEYEFDLVCSMDDENNLLIDKTRCVAYSAETRKVCNKPGPEYFRPFIEWLGPAATPAPPPAPAAVVAPAPRKPWTTFKGMVDVFKEMERSLAPDIYTEILHLHGVEQPSSFKSADAAWACYKHMDSKAQEFLITCADPGTVANFGAVEGQWQ